ncbi:hypothetical protein [Nocardia higoensis]|uniref:hypothetical protein n=1 Tax=Nocardia higoensis TaxID=228599 RepID=UPI003570C625
MRELARGLRNHASSTSVIQPVAKVSRDLARKNMTDSNFAVKVEESLKALDSVIQYHVRRMNEHSDAIDTSATTYEQADDTWANGFR